MSGKKKAARSRGKASGAGKPRFPGLLLHLLAFSIVALPLSLLFLIPATENHPSVSRPPFENFKPAPRAPAKRNLPHPKPHVVPRRPLLAILIDDMGYNAAIDRRFIDLEAPLSFAFLPYAPNTGEIARYAKRHGRDVLVHIPMEPENKAMDPGRGVLTVDMDLPHLVDVLGQDIERVPGAIGANNHMGSRFTKDRRAMEIVIAYLKSRKFFFVDSRTTKDTVAYKVAKEMGIRCAQRSVFLDHTLSRKSILHEIRRSIKLARKQGSVIAIGHPSRLMYQVLYDELPRLRKQVKLVPVHNLVH